MIDSNIRLFGLCPQKLSLEKCVRMRTCVLRLKVDALAKSTGINYRPINFRKTQNTISQEITELY
jgi:hypothetical protein